MKAAISLAILLAVLIAIGTFRPSQLTPAQTPQAAVESMYKQVSAKNWNAAYRYVAPSSNVDENTFIGDLNGRWGSLRTFSSLQSVETRPLKKGDDQALVRANLTWSTAVGPIYESVDLKVAREGGDWKVVWQPEKTPNLPPQVIPVNYLRWDIVSASGGNDEWGAQNAEPPRVRILSMNAFEDQGSTVIVGELENEDTVPGFVSVGATLLDGSNNPISTETSFDKISHVLLPKEITPFRIDFPGIKLANVKSVRMDPNALLVPASADPVIGVLHQQLTKDARGHNVLTGELVNQSGQVVNIPHVLATYYDASGKVIWVSDGYVDHALLPGIAEPFSVAIRDDLAAKVHSYRVTVNQYSISKTTS